MRRRKRSKDRPLLLGAIVVLTLTLGAWSAWRTCAFQGCPDPGELGAYQPGGAPVLLDRHGEEIAWLHPLEARVVPLDSLPEYVPAAFLAVEDRRFFRHGGVDWWRVLGAAGRNLAAGRVREGASTLSMQLARTLFPERLPGVQRTVSRKLLEVRVAMDIESRYGKDEILELYLNHVYMGGGAYGVEAGSRHYFDRPASELTLEEAAFLAGSLRAPAHFDPRIDPEGARQRRDLVLSLMEDQGLIEAEEALAARDRALTVSPDPASPGSDTRAPYFVGMVRSFLEEEFGEALYRSQMRVHTTLDSHLQALAETSLSAQLEAVEGGVHGGFAAPTYRVASVAEPGGSEYLQGAVVFLDPETGAVLALVGGRDFGSSRFNRALLARRQMGSAFKPFVFASALASGHVASQPLADRPITVPTVEGANWSPRNYDGEFRGTVAMRQALVESLNVPTVRLAMAAGLEGMSRIAEIAGFSEPVPQVPAAALGTGSASPLELAVAYSAFSAGGFRPTPRVVTRIEDAGGEVTYRAGAPSVTEVLDPRVAYLVTDILEDAVRLGTGVGARAAGYRGPVAGKTGTTQEAHDVWFVGFNPEVVGVVWMGFDRPRPILSGASGGRLAAPVWGAIMAEAYRDRDQAPAWVRPGGVVERSVDPETGRVVEDGCRSLSNGSVRELFLEEFVAVSECPESPGLRERVVGFFRGLRGGSDADDSAASGSSPEGQGGPFDVLGPGSSTEHLLGAPRVPLVGTVSGE